MAWFFRHESCSKATQLLRERIVAVETEERALKLQLDDLFERFLQFEGRVKKRDALNRAGPLIAEPEPAKPLSIGGIRGIRR